MDININIKKDDENKPESRPCAYCDGTGMTGLAGPTSETCTVCDGRKKICFDKGVNPTPCGKCDGTGKSGLGSLQGTPEKCSNCKGTGWLTT